MVIENLDFSPAYYLDEVHALAGSLRTLFSTAVRPEGSMLSHSLISNYLLFPHLLASYIKGTLIFRH